MQQLRLFNIESTELTIRHIKHKDARELVYNHHYLRGFGRSASCYGAFIGEQLQAVVIFQVPCAEGVRTSVFGPEYVNNVTELSRLCLHPNCTVPASKIVSLSIKAMNQYRQNKGQTKIHGIVSFADNSQGHHGGVYQSMSWLYTGTSKRLALIYTDQTGTIRHARQNGVNISIQDSKDRDWETPP